MRKFLIIDDERPICKVAHIGFQRWSGAEVFYASIVAEVARTLDRQMLEAAFIDASLPVRPGIFKADTAANENVPLRQPAEREPRVVGSDRLEMPGLTKPFSYDQAEWASRLAFAISRDTLRRVRASADQMREHTEVLASTVDTARRLTEDIRQRRCQFQTPFPKEHTACTNVSGGADYRDELASAPDLGA